MSKSGDDTDIFGNSWEDLIDTGAKVAGQQECTGTENLGKLSSQVIEVAAICGTKTASNPGSPKRVIVGFIPPAPPAPDSSIAVGDVKPLQQKQQAAGATSS